jgi:hypothetical protein
MLISVYKFECVGDFFFISNENPIKIEKLTNTFKLLHKNEHNANETSYLGVEEFHTPLALSLHILYLCKYRQTFIRQTRIFNYSLKYGKI